MIYIILITLLFYFVIEKHGLKQNRKKIKTVIAVTGTRGKTTVVRMLAAVLRKEGFNVLAKTTGTAANYILPNGSEEKIKRNRLVSILEQKNLFKKAAELNVEFVVTELMGIHPENIYTESRLIIKPEVLVITNNFPDHIDAMGSTEEEVSKVYAQALNQNLKLIIPKTAVTKSIKSKVEKLNVDLHCVEESGSKKNINQDLVKEICNQLNINPQKVESNLDDYKMDQGEIKFWNLKTVSTGKVLFVNLFAVNDTTTFNQILNDLKSKFSDITILYNHRSDRADRSKFWISYLNKLGLKVVLTGDKNYQLKKEIEKSEYWQNNLEKIISEIKKCENQMLFVGAGNIKGTGMEIIQYLNVNGEEYVF